jgi:PncC family amidohydrolase
MPSAAPAPGAALFSLKGNRVAATLQTPECIAEQLLRLLSFRRFTLVTAESCTAGMLARHLADVPGAGQYFHGGFVAYTKVHKHVALGVPADLLQRKGAVCVEVASAMAEGALRHSAADFAAAVTGVAGPLPDEDGNPVGRVCIAVVDRAGGILTVERHYAERERDAIRRHAMTDAMNAVTRAATAYAASSSSAG